MSPVDVVSLVDTDDVADAIKKLRENEVARQQLVALKAEVDQLQQALDAANQALAATSAQDEVTEASRHRADLLNQVQSDALVHQTWTEWVIAGAHLWSPCLPGSDLEWSMDCSRKPDDSSPPVPMSRPPNWQLRLSAGFPFSRPHLPQNQFSIFTGCSHWRRRLASWTDLPYP